MASRKCFHKTHQLIREYNTTTTTITTATTTRNSQQYRILILVFMQHIKTYLETMKIERKVKKKTKNSPPHLPLNQKWSHIHIHLPLPWHSKKILKFFISYCEEISSRSFLCLQHRQQQQLKAKKKLTAAASAKFK